MTDIQRVCKLFNLVYFDFLENTIASINDILSKKNYLDFYADMNENIKGKSIGIYIKHPSSSIIEKYNIGDNFYIGDFTFQYLRDSKASQSILFDILNHKSLEKVEIIRKLDKAINEEREKGTSFTVGGEMIEKSEYYKKKLENYIHEKWFYTYEHFLKYYEEGKYTNKNIYNSYKPTKESYLDYIFDTFQTPKLVLKKKLEAFIPNKERYKHTYITGSSGSGKSEAIKNLIFSVLRTQKDRYLENKEEYKIENFILIEPHGDLSDEIFNLALKYEGAYKYRTLLLDPFLDNEKTPIINPFDFKGNETDLNSYTEELISVFREILGIDFTLNAQALLTPCISTLLKIENSSLYDLQTFMSDDENKGLVEKGKITKNFAHKNFFENAFYSSNLSSTKKAIFLKLQILLNNKTFSNLTTGKSTFDLEYMMNNQKNLIVKLNKKRMRETLSPFGRFLIAKIQSIALKRSNIPIKLRPKTHLFLDEFQNFTTPSIEEILTESRKYQLFVTMAHQVISQIESTKLKDIILSNTNIKIVGSNGQKTLSTLSKEINVNLEELETLRTGNFYIKIDKNPAFKVYMQMLKPIHFKEDFIQKIRVKKLLLMIHYTKPTQTKLSLKAKPSKKYIDNIIKDKSDNDDIKNEIQTIKKPKFDTF
ncbi:MAG: Unknown protein [uncultured Campylobacterales bacterium]|uniref:Type IV secretion system coupling protein TraD DNA-binding domain-containing protein n=1 Tax=uncultured Campylobacterales bacterium TaxID=352960 RepID=A0A6S6T5Z7_9BACT|nr:MAG: Unknown protein [uncultured Campylobacterales bacterium]